MAQKFSDKPRVQLYNNTSHWMGNSPILLDVGLILLVFGLSFGLMQIVHRLIQYPAIVDS